MLKALLTKCNTVSFRITFLEKKNTLLLEFGACIWGQIQWMERCNNVVPSTNFNLETFNFETPWGKPTELISIEKWQRWSLDGIENVYWKGSLIWQPQTIQRLFWCQTPTIFRNVHFFLESLTENALGNNTGTAPGPWNGGFCLKIERLHQKQEQLQDLEVEYHQSNW